MSASSAEAIVIKKYANRRLYNTSTSTYVTLDDLAKMVKQNVEFNVYDAKSNEDITRSVLAQIIIEEEGKSGQNLLPVDFMRKLIGYYGNNMQWMVPKYLEQTMSSLSSNQEQIRDYFQKTMGGMFPFGTTLEQMSKQNMAMFERTMKMFTPFNMPNSEAGSDSSSSNESAWSSPAPSSSGPSSTSSSSPAPSSHMSSHSSSSASESSASDEQEKAEEAAFTPSVASGPRKVSVPMSETSKAAAAQSIPSGEDVQVKIAALQRQLSDLARNKASS